MLPSCFVCFTIAKIFFFQTALLLTCYMKSYTTYFSAPPSYEDLKILVFVLWKHIMQLICNGHAITTMHLEESKNVTVFEKSETRTGTAIFPSVSMMNHSCEPSIINRYNY